MHLFIVAITKFNMPSSILEANIKDVLESVVLNKEGSIVIVGYPYSTTFRQQYEKLDNVSFASIKEASSLIKKVANARVLHFGDNVKWAQNIPLYFMPLVLPAEIANLSLLKSVLFKRAFNKWLKKATKILAVNDWTITSLQHNFPEFIPKMELLQLPITVPNSLEWAELSAAKEDIANGNNYFLFFAPVDRFVAILKEFSIFKKWQQTTMNLVMVLENQQQVDKAMVLLNGYKFKQDILLYTVDEVHTEWLAASYAILWEGIYSSKTNWITKSIQYDIPMLFDDQVSLPDSWLKAGEVFSFKESQVLSNHFKLYYKDEIYRQARARMGKEWLQTVNQGIARQELFNNIVLSHIN